ncbi:MAG: vitamin B12-dependent ribonucleotide reductase [Chloroflexi bacterium]|nr:vitamin B12-dependent ribonucleotide reductase [Chloroflexota bacterium]
MPNARKKARGEGFSSLPSAARGAPSAESPAGLQLSPSALTVLQKRYLAKNSEGRVMETPEEMFQRVAQNLSLAERKYSRHADIKAVEQEFYKAMASLEFLPNSPTIMNAGRELQQLSACFVLPIEDSIEAIFDAVKHTALIHKSGGGTGFSFSRLRPAGDVVGSTGGVASGPVSFAKIFDATTEQIKQGGTRRGANMGILSVNHPDILDFIRSKQNGASLQNFNISVAANEEFMRAVEKGEDYDIINPRTRKPERKLNARKVFNLIAELAWQTGDPGLVFLDRINRDNPTPALGEIESTNPCGEQPLLPFESCNLGSVNLAKMLRQEGNTYAIDWDKLAKTVRTAVRLLDNVIEMNKYPVHQIEEMTKKTRKIGLGVMGFADMLILLGIPYDSEEALAIGERIMAFISEKSNEASAMLAQERGAFPAWEDSIYNRPGGMKYRNATRTTIAPTGTLSIIADCSSGIEPLFALSYVRNVLDNNRLIEVNPYFEEVARREGFYSKELMEALAEKGSVRDIAGVPEWIKRIFVSAHDISPEWHIRMQAAFQRHTDNAVSKTVNFPHRATVEDVAKVYMLAYKEGCKGITIFRDGSKDKQVLSTGLTEKLKETDARTGTSLVPRERPQLIQGVTERIRTGHGNMYITINFDESGRPFEVFSTLGKAGGCDSAQLEAISRLISLALRSGIPTEQIIEQLRGITCCPSWDRGVQVKSAPDAVAIALSHALQQWKELPRLEKAFAAQLGLLVEDNGNGKRPLPCPECSGQLIYQEGCFVCRACGYNKCG